MFQGLRIPVVYDATGVDKKEGVTHLSKLRQDVGRDEDGLPFLGKDTDEVFQFDPGPGVKAGSRLIHDKDLRVMQERSSEAKSLSHALGKLVGEPVGQGDEVSECHDLFNAATAFVAGLAKCPRIKIKILKHRHMLIVAKVIGHPPDERAHLVRMINHADTTDLR